MLHVVTCSEMILAEISWMCCRLHFILLRITLSKLDRDIYYQIKNSSPVYLIHMQSDNVTCRGLQLHASALNFIVCCVVGYILKLLRITLSKLDIITECRIMAFF